MGCESEVLLYTNYMLTALSGDFKKQKLNFCVCVYSFLFLYFTSYLLKFSNMKKNRII